MTIADTLKGCPAQTSVHGVVCNEADGKRLGPERSVVSLQRSVLGPERSVLHFEVVLQERCTFELCPLSGHEMPSYGSYLRQCPLSFAQPSICSTDTLAGPESQLFGVLLR